MRAILEVQNLTFVRGQTTVLDGITWRVEPSQHWAIIGPNGCGKTTLLRTLTGYLSATSGEIVLLGQSYGSTDWRVLRERVGLVTSALQHSIPPAEPAIETVISGKYAQLNLWKAVTPADLRQARRFLKQVALSHLERREWLYLSQGERQRVLIARALMARPDLLILDEPCAGLDPVAREDFLQFIQALAEAPRSPALVLVTHHVEEIMPAFTHALLLRAGKVVQAGSRKEILKSESLSRTFGRDLRITEKAGRLALSVFPGSS